MSRMPFLSQNTVHFTFCTDSVCFNFVLTTVPPIHCLMFRFRSEVRNLSLIARNDPFEEPVTVIVAEVWSDTPKS